MLIAYYRGKTRLFNKFVSWWTRGPYSHTEAIFTGRPTHDVPKVPVLCGSSSYMDGGVRLKVIDLEPEKWDILDVPSVDDQVALAWFIDHQNDEYDVVGLLSTSTPIKDSQTKEFCSEAIGAACGLAEPWRFHPNSFARVMERLPGSRWLRGGPNT